MKIIPSGAEQHDRVKAVILRIRAPSSALYQPYYLAENKADACVMHARRASRRSGYGALETLSTVFRIECTITNYVYH